MRSEESTFPAEASTAAKALSWMSSELAAIAGGDPFDPGLRDTLIALISHNEEKVTALADYAEALERADAIGRGETEGTLKVADNG